MLQGFGCHPVLPPNLGSWDHPTLQDRWADSYITGESNHYWTFGRGPQGKSRVLKARAMVANKLRNGIMQKEMPNLNSHIPKPEMTKKTVMVKELSDLITFVLGKKHVDVIVYLVSRPCLPFPRCDCACGKLVSGLEPGLVIH